MGRRMFRALGHLLGIVEKGVVEVFREYDCGGIYRTGEGTASGFVASGFHTAGLHVLQQVYFFWHGSALAIRLYQQFDVV